MYYISVYIRIEYLYYIQGYIFNYWLLYSNYCYYQQSHLPWTHHSSETLEKLVQKTIYDNGVAMHNESFYNDDFEWMIDLLAARA